MTTQYVRHTVNLTKDVTTSSHTTTDFTRVLVCDVETTLDFSQQLRLSGYTLYDRETGDILERGLTTGVLSHGEHVTLQDYARARNLVVLTHDDFIVTRLYPWLAAGTALVNHNIVFDIGAMAHSWVGAGDTFYMKLCPCTPTGDNLFICEDHAPIAVRSLNFPKALIYVASADTPYAPILDTMTIGRALLGPGDMSLKGMGTRFKCKTLKETSDDHGDTLTVEYLDYTMRDVQATLELFIAEVREYTRHGLSAPIASIMSEASIGKAYLQQLRIPAFYQKHQELPAWLNSTAISAYYGARSEVKIRLGVAEIRYCDFKSQYPTVNALLNLQELLLSEYITVKHNTATVQRFLDAVQLDDLQRPEVWRKLRVLVKFAPTRDIVPNKFSTVDTDGSKASGYAVCYTTGPENWYALCDAVASKLLTGVAPKLVDAICMYPTGRVPTQKLALFGDATYSIDLTKQDFFTEVINLRTSVKRDMKVADTTNDVDQVHYLNSLQLALKLLANSTSYGVLVETRYEKGVETAGRYYASPVAVHITAAARLLLAIAERLGRDRGLEYAMCDTDSMAYARPEAMTRETFTSLVDECVHWFNPLSPYALDDKGNVPALFELEDVNTYDGHDTPLYFIGVSCKRYALYNRLENGSYRIRKISAHATGRYSFDRDLPIPDGVPEVPFSLQDGKKVKQFKDWHYMLWYRAIEDAEAGREITIPDEAWSRNIARYQESISTPGKAKMYSYIPGIRPYSFFTAFPVAIGSKHRYIMPYSATDAAIRDGTVYCTGTMQIEASPVFDSLAVRFSSFFTHAEGKAANGHDKGVLQRRELVVQEINQRTRTGKIIKPTVAADYAAGTLWDMVQ